MHFVTLGSDGLFGLDADKSFVIILTAIGCGTAIIISVAGMLHSMIEGCDRRRIERELKQEMLDRGMSAEEIAKVIEAAPPSQNPTARWMESWCKNR